MHRKILGNLGAAGLVLGLALGLALVSAGHATAQDGGPQTQAQSQPQPRPQSRPKQEDPEAIPKAHVDLMKKISANYKALRAQLVALGRATGEAKNKARALALKTVRRIVRFLEASPAKMRGEQRLKTKEAIADFAKTNREVRAFAEKLAGYIAKGSRRTNRTYKALIAKCNGCHATYRPGGVLAPRKPGG